MSEKNNGGPAFPIPVTEGNHQNPWNISGGLSIRQYYAAQAMQGELAAQGDYYQWTKASSRDLASLCFRYADALIEFEQEERNANPIT